MLLQTEEQVHVNSQLPVSLCNSYSWTLLVYKFIILYQFIVEYSGPPFSSDSAALLGSIEIIKASKPHQCVHISLTHTHTILNVIESFSVNNILFFLGVKN